jgi:protein-L-isoaspartate(D-aspartate) O-methyltransferase
MTNETLIAFLKETGAIRTATVEEAFRAVDRARFVPETSKSVAYLDTALPLCAGQTISQPTVVAYCLELLRVFRGARVLDVGSGSGWTTALLAHLVGPTGSVIGLERIPALVSFGSENLSAYAFPYARIEQTAYELGLAEAAPFDSILVSASAEEMPEGLARQLADGGRMVIPIRDAICAVDRTGDNFSTACRKGFVFVPLITSESQQTRKR